MTSPLAIWGVVYSLYGGMPAVHEEMIFPADIGCGQFCNAYVRNAMHWAASQGLSTQRGNVGNCTCILVRECAREDCAGENLFSNLKGDTR